MVDLMGLHELGPAAVASTSDWRGRDAAAATLLSRTLSLAKSLSGAFFTVNRFAAGAQIGSAQVGRPAGKSGAPAWRAIVFSAVNVAEIGHGIYRAHTPELPLQEPPGKLCPPGGCQLQC